MEESEFITKTCTSGRGGWLREKLISICNSLKISSVGNKKQLCDVIKQYYISYNLKNNNTNDNTTINKEFTLQDLNVNIEDGNLEVVKLFFKEIKDIKHKNDALLTAAKFKHLNIIKFLIENGADIHFENDEVLMISSNYGDIDTVKYLIDNGINANAQNNKAILICARQQKYEILKYLIQHGADIHTDNELALSISLQKNNLELTKLLVEHGADIGAIHDNILENCLQYGNIDIIKYLIEAGANTDIKRIILIESVQLGYLDLIKFLIENGTDIHYRNDHILILSAARGHFEILKFLIENGADIHTGNDEALVMSASFGHLEIIKFLIENGADINTISGQPLVLSASFGHLEVLKFLIENGADIHARKEFALRQSITHRHFEIIKCLVENGADINVQKDSILRESISMGDLRVVRYLVENGATFNKDTINFSIENHKKRNNNKITNYLISVQKNFKIKKALKTIHNKVKNKKYYYKWQEMCLTLDNKNLLELQNLSILHNIDITNKSKRELCKDLAIQYEQELINFDTSKCHNEYTILGDPVNLIPKPLLYSLKEGNQVYCFNIIELIEMINKNDVKNPFTRVLLPIDDIKKRMLILRQTLIEDKLSLVNILDEIKNNKIMTTESILKLQIINLIALLNYTPNVDIIANMNELQINLMFNYLNGNPLTKVYGEHTKSNLIMESLRILNIDDSNTNTRKAAYEIYLNELFKVDD